MIQIFTIVFCLVSVILSFISPIWSWLPIGLCFVFMLITLMVLKQRKWQHVDELSPAANQMLQKFGYYYSMPFAATEFSSSASTIQVAAVAIGILGAFQGFWWGLGLSAITWFVMGPVSAAFNPSNFLQDSSMQMAHQEVIGWIMSQPDR